MRDHQRNLPAQRLRQVPQHMIEGLIGNGRAHRHGRRLRLALEALPHEIAVEVDRDDQIRPQRAADRDRDRIGKAAVHKPMIADPGRTDDPGQGDRGAHDIVYGSGLQPNLAAGDQIGGDGRVFLVVILDPSFDAEPLQKCDDLFSLDQPPPDSRTSISPAISRQVAAIAHCRSGASRPAT